MNRLCRMLFYGASAGCLLTAAAVDATPVNWDFSQVHSEWLENPRYVTPEWIDGALRLTLTGTDSSIENHSVNFPPGNYNALVLEYKANGFRGTPHGQLFFSGDGKQGFSEQGKFLINGLVADGTVRKTMVVLDGEAGGHWRKSRRITALRLDPADEYPGIFELRKLIFCNDGDALKMSADTRCRWDFTRACPEWGDFYQAAVKGFTPEGVKLQVHGPDFHLEHKNLQLDPKRHPRIRIRYQATGFPQSTSGEIFFKTARLTGYDEQHCVRLPPLLTDGREHVLEIHMPDALGSNAELWRNAGTVTALRLDLVNEFPGQICLKSIEALSAAPPSPGQDCRVELNDGWWVPRPELQGGQVSVSLPPGRYRVFAYGEGGSVEELRRQLSVPGKNGWKNTWCELGEHSVTAQQPFILREIPDSVLGIAITTGAAPRLVSDEVPPQVKSELRARPVQGLFVRFDSVRPYFRSRMLTPADGLNNYGKARVRRTFTVRRNLCRALLQIVADDRLMTVALNGRLPTGKLSQNWKVPSVFDVKSLLTPGENFLALEYFNDGGVGGVMYDLTLLYDDNSYVIIAGNGSERAISGGSTDNGWTQPLFDDGDWPAAETHNGPPHAPWNTCTLPYSDILPPGAAGKIEVLEIAVPPPDKPHEPLLRLRVKATPEFTAEDAYRVVLTDAAGNEAGFASGTVLEKLSGKRGDGSVELLVGDFGIPEYGGGGKLRFSVSFRHRQTSSVVTGEILLAERPLPDAARRLRVTRECKSDGEPLVLVNDKPFFPLSLSIFYERDATGLEGADSPFNVRSFLSGGASDSWWVGPDRYDFNNVDRRITKLLKEYPNCYVAAWVYCQPPPWYGDVYPGRIARQSDGGTFPYYVSTITLSDPDYRAEAQRAIQAFVEHCEKYFGSRMFAYNLCGGISLEWQGWGCHDQAIRKVLNDYSNSARRDFAEFVRERHPEWGTVPVPAFSERVRRGRSVFRDPVREATHIAFDEYQSEATAECIAQLAATAKRACRDDKLVGAYYGYHFEYANMDFCINTSGHNAAHRLIDDKNIDFLLSPPSYLCRAVGESGGEMKPFGSLLRNGKFSLLEDDTRSHLIEPTYFNQAVNGDQLREILRRNWGMVLARRMPVVMFPIYAGYDFNAPEIRRDLHRVRKLGELLVNDPKRHSRTEVAVVVDEQAYFRLRPDTTVAPRSRDRILYGPDGKVRREAFREQHLTGALVALQRQALQSFGAATDWLLLEDVPSTVKNYKLWIFLDTFTNRAALQNAIHAIREQGGTVLIVYGAGFATPDQAVDAQAMSKLWGWDFERIAVGGGRIAVTNPTLLPGMTTLAYGGADRLNPRFAIRDAQTAVWGRYADGGNVALGCRTQGKVRMIFSGATELPPEMLRKIAESSGVFIHNRSDEPFFAGFGLYTLHSRFAGDKEIMFPNACDVVDAYSGEVLGRQVKKVTLRMAAMTTRTLLTGNSAEELLKALNVR